MSAYRLLARHDELHAALDRPRVRVLAVHERHHCPRRLHRLRLLVLDPLCDLATLPISEQKSACRREEIESGRTL